MAETVIHDVDIDQQRLCDALAELARVGSYEDTAAGVTGVNRLALTDADAEARRLVCGWFEAAGLLVHVDRIGNIYATRAGSEPGLAPVMCASHIDSVPTAGAFDGCLGVLGGLEIVRALNDRGVTTRRPLVLGVMTDEEGCRFGTDMLGSAVATGRLQLDDAWALSDRDGKTVRAELERTGFLGDLDVDAIRPHAFVECHIEQGPVLARRGVDIGVVTGVQGISWQRLVIRGRSAHAGTTPMEYRADPGVAASQINLRLREMTASGDYGDAMRATMGCIDPVPGAINVVPSTVTATVDLRNPDDEHMARAEADLRSFFAEVEQREGVQIESFYTARTPAVAFDGSVQDLIEQVAGGLGLSQARILSGAGHDAQEWSRVAKTAMVFIPGENDGISHNPREYSTPEQCGNGVRVLLHTLLTLLDEE